MNYLNEVRHLLIEEARNSPQMLSDIAGLERYIAETYYSRSFIELLQNADDAHAKRFKISKHGNYVIAANDGIQFTHADLEALCRSASSNKSRSTTIGYRGIGFKSVVGFADEVHLISGSLETTFSRSLTKEALGMSTDSPLIRIPHALSKTITDDLKDELEQYTNEGYTTVFIFSDVIGSFAVEEFNSIEPRSLIFLNHIEQVSLTSKKSPNVEIRRISNISAIRQIELKDGELSSLWDIYTKGSATVALAIEGDSYIALNKDVALAYAFLPTMEPSGFGFLCNGDFSTDPSRTKIIYDKQTQIVLDDLVELYIELLDESCNNPTKGLIQALLPIWDIKLLKFQTQKSLCHKLIDAVSKKAPREIKKLTRAPKWLNEEDCEALCKHIGLEPLHLSWRGDQRIDALLTNLGVEEISLESVLNSNFKSLSVRGCAQITAEICKRNNTKQLKIDSSLLNSLSWVTLSRTTSLTDLKDGNEQLSSDFIEALSELGIFTSDLKRLFVSTIGELPDGLISYSTSEKQSEGKVPTVTLKSAIPGSQSDKKNIPFQKPSIPISIKKWRSAEIYVKTILEAKGFSPVTDVSKQNVGYDILAIAPNGNEFYYEVKLVERESQPFSLTNNEKLTAHEHGENYFMAIVKVLSDAIEIGFIQNPEKHLTMEKQCKAWVWLCEDYDFTPERYNFVEI